MDADENKVIILEESDPPGEPVTMLSVISAQREEQRLIICAKAASLLAKRFKRPMQAIKGPLLRENQELIYDADGCLAILDKTSIGSQTFETVFVHCDRWNTHDQAIWQHELRESISTFIYPQGQLALIVINELGITEGRLIPMEFAKVLARRFGKRIDPPTQTAGGGSKTHVVESVRSKAGGCASVFCLGLALIAVVAMLPLP